MNTALTTALTSAKGRTLALLLAGNLLLAVSSKICLPLVPVPVTLQSFAVILIAMLYGARLGTATVALFLLEGLLGIPVLAIGSWATMGYALGFIPAAWLCGRLSEQNWCKNMLGAALAAFLGISIIMAFGLSVLHLYTDWNTAIAIGLKPFLLGEGLKILMLSIVVTGSQGLIAKLRC